MDLKSIQRTILDQIKPVECKVFWYDNAINFIDNPDWKHLSYYCSAYHPASRSAYIRRLKSKLHENYFLLHEICHDLTWDGPQEEVEYRAEKKLREISKEHGWHEFIDISRMNFFYFIPKFLWVDGVEPKMTHRTLNSLDERVDIAIEKLGEEDNEYASY